jgi:hypothetical protein
MEKTLILVLTFSIVIGCNDEKKDGYLTEEIKRLKIENDSLKSVILRSRNQIDLLKTQIELTENYWFDRDFDGSELIKKGIKNPEQYIENNLRNNQELIPLDGILGGVMHFSKIQVISKNWIIAEYDDGHIVGKSLFKFEFKDSNKLEFKILDSIVK